MLGNLKGGRLQEINFQGTVGWVGTSSIFGVFTLTADRVAGGEIDARRPAGANGDEGPVRPRLRLARRRRKARRHDRGRA